MTSIPEEPFVYSGFQTGVIYELNAKVLVVYVAA